MGRNRGTFPDVRVAPARGTSNDLGKSGMLPRGQWGASVCSMQDTNRQPRRNRTLITLLALGLLAGTPLALGATPETAGVSVVLKRQDGIAFVELVQVEADRAIGFINRFGAGGESSNKLDFLGNAASGWITAPGQICVEIAPYGDGRGIAVRAGHRLAGGCDATHPVYSGTYDDLAAAPGAISA